VLLAVERAREALDVCERLSARRVELLLVHTRCMYMWYSPLLLLWAEQA
jgi:hypothetical protein|tara:strand:- start:236 stop:382 length:147 start_codon:yes stop_codon:yes gene_type:complete